LSGGWSQHDEACTHYEDIINNMMVGHEFLKKEFDLVPTVGWQIDSFGHSSSNARLFAEMGFDAIILNRIDFEDKLQRKNAKTLEFLWRPSHKTLGADAEIFAHILYDHYISPKDFGFDPNNFDGKDTFNNDTNSLDYNAPKKSK
jgi:hypothetical protein